MVSLLSFIVVFLSYYSNMALSQSSAGVLCSSHTGLARCILNGLFQRLPEANQVEQEEATSRVRHQADASESTRTTDPSVSFITIEEKGEKWNGAS
jgi:hypothetical protein